MKWPDDFLTSCPNASTVGEVLSKWMRFVDSIEDSSNNLVRLQISLQSNLFAYVVRGYGLQSRRSVECHIPGEKLNSSGKTLDTVFKMRFLAVASTHSSRPSMIISITMH